MQTNNFFWFQSNYSLLTSSLSIDKIIEFSLKNNLKSIMLADINNVFGLYKFYKKCIKNNIKPILGIEYNDGFQNIILIAKNYMGLKYIIEVSSNLNNSDHIETEDYFKIILKKTNNVAIYIIKKIGKDEINIYKERFKEVYFNDSIYSNDQTLSLKLNNYIDNKKILKILISIKDNLKHKLEYYNTDLNEEKRIIQDNSQNNLNLLINKCNVMWTKKTVKEVFETSEDIENSLYRLAMSGLKIRFKRKEVPVLYLKRFEKEFAVFKELNFCKYLLIVYDYVKYSFENGILVGPGRGSAAGSLICYSLFITEIDPVKNNLIFERFLNKYRTNLPDIDIDIQDNKRDKVINYILEKYTDYHSAQIITFQRIKFKSAVRDILRTLITDITNKQISHEIKEIFSRENLMSAMTFQETKDPPIKKIINTNKITKMISYSYPNNKIWKFVFKNVGKIYNFPRNIGIHPGGVIIHKESLKNETGIIVNKAKKIITQFDMNDLEELGFLKVDILGLTNLTTIIDCLKNIYKTYNISINLNKIPLDNQKTFKLLSSGDTEGLFQLESPGMRSVLKKMKVNSFEDIVAVISLFRPGPMKNIDQYIKGKNNPNKISYPNEIFKNITQSTYGIIVFQEQIIQILVNIAGFSLMDADMFRRAISKKKSDIFNKYHEKFIQNVIKRNNTKEYADSMYDIIEKFSNYGFNKSHAYSYALISYYTAFLKANFFLPFYCCLLNNSLGNDNKITITLNSLKSKGINIYHSSSKNVYNEFTIKNNSIYTPLWIIKGITVNANKKIYDLFKKISLEDKINKIFFEICQEIQLPIIKELIKYDFFQNLSIKKNILLEKIDEIYKWAKLGDIDIPFSFK